MLRKLLTAAPSHAASELAVADNSKLMNDVGDFRSDNLF